MKLSDQYDFKALRKYCGILAVTLLLYKLTSGYAACLVTLMVIFAVAKRKPIELMFWVLFMTLSAMGNITLFMRGPFNMLITRVTLLLLTFVMSAKVFNSRSSRAAMPFWGILLYMFWEVISSAQGYEPIVSYLKLSLFFCIFLAMFGVANEVNASTRVNAKILRSAIMSTIIFMIIGSVVLFFFPSIGMMHGRGDIAKMMSGEITSLFCGMCSHSQAMGPFAGVMCTFVFADLLFSIKKWDPIYLSVLVSCPLVVWRSSSRTGMGTLGAGVLMVVLLFLHSRGVGARWKGKVLMVLTCLGICGMVMVMAVPSAREKAIQFMLKTKEDDAKRSELSMENMMSSRQGLIEESMYGFRQSPIFGNGFQVSREMLYQHRSGIWAYLAAPIEKGVWVYAILEEGGAIGFVLFSGWLIFLFFALLRRHAYVMLSTFFAFMMANLGEFCIFSMTYIGGFYWTLTFAAGTLDVQRMKGQGIEVFEVPLEQVMEEIGYDEWVRLRG